MTDALIERRLEAVELILAAAAQSPAMADEATREALDFARPLLQAAPTLSAFVEQLAGQIVGTGQDRTPQGRALARSAGELIILVQPA
jgi:hypothetical protein